MILYAMQSLVFMLLPPGIMSRSEPFIQYVLARGV